MRAVASRLPAADVEAPGAGATLTIDVPRPFVVVRIGRALVAARPEAVAAARRAVETAGSLYRFAAGSPAAERLEGRGPAFRLRADGVDWVVRHYRRGGWMAPLLGDRYVRIGRPRPVRELEASEAVRLRGIETPRVEALAVHPAGAFYRAELATAHVAGSADLVRVLFGPDAWAGEDRRLALEAAGRLLAGLPAHAIIHADLNLKNVLLCRTERPPRALLLDLDRCRVVERVTARQAQRMRRRFLRSLEKWQARTGRRLEPAELAALRFGRQDARERLEADG